MQTSFIFCTNPIRRLDNQPSLRAHVAGSRPTARPAPHAALPRSTQASVEAPLLLRRPLLAPSRAAAYSAPRAASYPTVELAAERDDQVVLARPHLLERRSLLAQMPVRRSPDPSRVAYGRSHCGQLPTRDRLGSSRRTCSIPIEEYRHRSALDRFRRSREWHPRDRSRRSRAVASLRRTLTPRALHQPSPCTQLQHPPRSLVRTAPRIGPRSHRHRHRRRPHRPRRSRRSGTVRFTSAHTRGAGAPAQMQSNCNTLHIGCHLLEASLH